MTKLGTLNVGQKNKINRMKYFLIEIRFKCCVFECFSKKFVINSKWAEIAGIYFKEYSEPLNVSRVRDFENDLGETVYKNYLNVSVAPAAAIEFQHFKDTIIEKINTYFGYKAITDLRIHQNYIPTYNNMKQSKKKQIDKDDKEFVKQNVKEFQNSDLKKSLLHLGNKIITEDK